MMTKSDAIRQYRGWLEHSPTDPGPMAPDLLGWLDPSGCFICAHCAGRIMARGCSLDTGSVPVYAARPPSPCDLCGKEPKQ